MSRRSWIAMARRRRCAGSVYVLVLGASMLVTVIGVGSVLALRAQSRASQADADFAEARLYAQGAIERGRNWITSDSGWRSARPHGTWLSSQAVGNGTFSLEGTDPADGSLTDAFGEDFLLTGTGQRRSARYMLQVNLRPVLTPIEPLFYGVHAKQALVVASGAKLTVSQGAASTDSDLDVTGTLVSSVASEAKRRKGTGNVTPVPILTTAKKNSPDGRVFNMYRSLATTISVGGLIEKRVLTPWRNPWGTPNADGVYFVDAGGADVTIRASRIHGTLVVRAKRVILDDAAFLHPYRADYPALIVDGELEILLKSGAYPLRESGWSTNFNPTSAAYNGITDSDDSDEYHNEVRGLVHASRPVTLGQTARVAGGIVGEDQVIVLGQNEVVLNQSLTVPCWGYVWESRYEPVVGSWKQTVLP